MCLTRVFSASYRAARDGRPANRRIPTFPALPLLARVAPVSPEFRRIWLGHGVMAVVDELEVTGLPRTTQPGRPCGPPALQVRAAGYDVTQQGQVSIVLKPSRPYVA